MEFDCGEQCGAGSVGRLVRLEEAEGLILAHDVTEIVPGQSKGPAFRKGHVVAAGDLGRLARMGKNHLYVLEIGPEEVHEDEAAVRLARALAGEGVEPAGPPREGKVTLVASREGLLRVDRQRLVAFNLVPEVMCATIHGEVVVRRGQAVGGTRAIPLVASRANLERAESLAAREGGLLRVEPLARLSAGVVVTGDEVAGGLIEDRFAPVVTAKLEALGSRVLGVSLAPDDRAAVAQAIRSQTERGAELIITTAGMSVDPDDVTRLGVADAGARVVSYGAPVLPGAMFLYAELEAAGRVVPVLGVPACALFHPVTILDLVLPRVLSGESLAPEAIAELAYGGYCQGCAEGCRFPACGFGRS
jgi:hypothetical protein